MKPRRPTSSVGFASCKNIIFSRMLVLGLVTFVTGCAVVRGEVGKPFAEDRIGELQKGQSTRQDVAQRFGAPDEIVEANGYEIFHYRRFDSKFGWLIFMSRLNVASDNLWIFFNEKGIVEDVVYGNRTDAWLFKYGRLVTSREPGRSEK